MSLKLGVGVGWGQGEIIYSSMRRKKVQYLKSAVGYTIYGGREAHVIKRHNLHTHSLVHSIAIERQFAIIKVITIIIINKEYLDLHIKHT